MRVQFGRACLPCFLILIVGGWWLMPNDTLAARQPAHNKKQAIPRIQVNALSPRTGGATPSATLTDALAQAARDPKDNVIESDPALATTGAITIALTSPIVIDRRES